MADPSETTQVSREPTEPNADELLVAVRSLATQVGGLQSELHALRAHTRALPNDDGERPGWDDHVATIRPESAGWVRSLDAPSRRGPSIPWLFVEIVFLVAVAILAVVAGLDVPAIVGVMVVAWGLVAASEWLQARTRRLEEAALFYGATAAPAARSDPSWLGPPVERTVLDLGDAADGAAPRLPPPQPE